MECHGRGVAGSSRLIQPRLTDEEGATGVLPLHAQPDSQVNPLQTGKTHPSVASIPRLLMAENV